MTIKMSRPTMRVPKDEDGPLDKEYEELVTRTLERWHVPGVAVAVVDGEKTYARGYGIASLPDIPVTPSTLFYVGSTTKGFTAATMAVLVEDNENYPQVQWHTPIRQLLPDEFELEDEYATNHTTIEDALSHRSGLGRHDQAFGATSSGSKATIQYIVQSMRYLPMTAEPRTKYQYSNMMYIVAARIIETVTGRTLGDIMRDKLWGPLRMTSTFASLKEAREAEEDLARGYYFSDGGYHEVEWVELDQSTGCGSVISNVLDYTKWARAIMNKETPISAKEFEELFRPRSFMPAEEPYLGPRMYSMGWRTGVYHGHKFYEHTGGMNAFGAEFILFPDKKFSVVSFANTAGTSNFAEQVLAFKLVDDKLGVPMEERFDWNKQNQAIVSRGQYNARHAKALFFPTLPSPVLPHARPLASYSGTYHHPGYQNLTITFDDSTNTLHADRSSSAVPEYMSFEHVSGEHFLITSKIIGDLNALFPEIYPAEFRVGVDGQVKQVGIRWEEQMGEDKIWLTRVVSK